MAGAARARMARRIAGNGIFILLTTAPMRPRVLFRVRNRVAERPKKGPEGSRFRRLPWDQHSQDRQRNDKFAQRPFHNDR